jgi:hypothetical protein
MSEDDKARLPKSLGHYTIEPEVLEQIGPHVNRLSETALQVSEELPLGASTGDIFRVLEQE